MFTAEMTYAEALRIVADSYATKPKKEADKICAEYLKVSDEILKRELADKNSFTSYEYRHV